MKKLIFSARSVLTFALFMFVIIVPGTALAAESDSIAIYPTFSNEDDFRSKGWFIYNLKNSERFIDYITIYNPSQKNSLIIDIYPVDALTTQDGVFSLANRGSKKEDVGAWIRLGNKPLDVEGYSENEIIKFSLDDIVEEKIITRETLAEIPLEFIENETVLEVEIGPEQKRIIPFEIAIPAFADTGDHAGGIIAENKNVEHRGSLNFVSRVGARVYETIPGEIVEKLNVDRFDKKEGFFNFNFSVALSNAGNVKAIPKISMEIKNIFTSGKLELPGPEDRTILPSKNITLPITFKKRGFGIFKYSVFLQNKDGPRETIAHGYFASPVFVSCILLFTLALVLFGIRKIHRKRKNRRRKK